MRAKCDAFHRPKITREKTDKIILQKVTLLSSCKVKANIGQCTPHEVVDIFYHVMSCVLSWPPSWI